VSERVSNFIRTVIDDDLAEGRHSGVVTRFPPEPNGYLHIGHSKAICLNFGLARDYNGRCHLRFDDTNPAKEDDEYVRAIQEDIRWLGFDWGEHKFHASDYFGQLYAWAEHLVSNGRAFVCSQTLDEMRATRGTVTEAGTHSPDRDRSVQDNLDLLRSMRAGEFADGTYTLRAKIDMASANMKMRDPPMYRIRHETHHHTGDEWCIYPFYDFAHGLSDAIEQVTHSICTLEFENNRELYDWYVEHCPVPAVPHQYEFARLKLTYTVMSKRKMLALVQSGAVSGWDDPRMPTLAAFRRRGVRPEAIRTFAEMVGVARANSVVDVGLLEHAIRDDLNHEAPRVMAVLRPVKLIIDSFPEGETDWIDASYWPHDIPKEGSRKVAFTRELYIEADDFAEVPPRKWRRMTVGQEIRLRYGYVVRCTSVEKDSDGNIEAIHASHDPKSRGGRTADGRKVKGTIHWVSAKHGVQATMRLYDRLYSVPEPKGELDELNPDALVELHGWVEPSLKGCKALQRFQFERQGYFMSDPVDSTPEALVFNRIVSLKDTWTKTDAPSATPPKVASVPKQTAKKRVISDEVLAHPDFAKRVALGLSNQLSAVLVERSDFGAFFDQAANAETAQGVANLLINGVMPEVDAVAALPFGASELAALSAIVAAERVTSRGAKNLLAAMLANGGDPEELLVNMGLERVDDVAALAVHVDAAMANNPDELARYRGGNPRLLGFFVGKVMKATRGSADPKVVQSLLKERLDG
jgi:glutaminyl-tRNA synthetase